MTTYLIVFAAIVRRLGGTSAKRSADAHLRKLYSQYWTQATALAQARMLEAPSDEQWLAEIRERAFASTGSDTVQRGPARLRAAGFSPAFATGYGRLRRHCHSVLHHRAITVTVAAAAVVLTTSAAFAAVGPPPASPYLKQVSAVEDTYVLQFPPDQSKLSDADRNTLDGLVHAIEQSAAPVTVNGYADGLDTEAANLELALERAQAVAAFLQSRGISASRLLVRGVRLHVPGPASRSVTIFIWGHTGAPGAAELGSP